MRGRKTSLDKRFNSNRGGPANRAKIPGIGNKKAPKLSTTFRSDGAVENFDKLMIDFYWANLL
jgi:hypothetical protein